MRPRAGIAAFVIVAGVANNMCVLKGFPTALAKSATDTSDFPFGIWFANPTTLYVADEGSDDTAFAGGSYTAVTDKLGATMLPASEKFSPVVAPRDDQVVHGVSFTLAPAGSGQPQAEAAAGPSAGAGRRHVLGSSRTGSCFTHPAHQLVPLSQTFSRW